MQNTGRYFARVLTAFERLPGFLSPVLQRGVTVFAHIFFVRASKFVSQLMKRRTKAYLESSPILNKLQYLLLVRHEIGTAVPSDHYGATSVAHPRCSMPVPTPEMTVQKSAGKGITCSQHVANLNWKRSRLDGLAAAQVDGGPFPTPFHDHSLRTGSQQSLECLSDVTSHAGFRNLRMFQRDLGRLFQRGSFHLLRRANHDVNQRQ